MPTCKQFLQARQAPLLRQISLAGGLRKLAPRLNLLHGAKTLPTTNVSDPANSFLKGMYWEPGSPATVSTAVSTG